MVPHRWLLPYDSLSTDPSLKAVRLRFPGAIRWSVSSFFFVFLSVFLPSFPLQSVFSHQLGQMGFVFEDFVQFPRKIADFGIWVCVFPTFCKWAWDESLSCLSIFAQFPRWRTDIGFRVCEILSLCFCVFVLEV